MFNTSILIFWTTLAVIVTALANIKPFMEWKPWMIRVSNAYGQPIESPLGPGCLVSYGMIIWRFAVLYYAINALVNGYGIPVYPAIIAASAATIIMIFMVLAALQGVIAYHTAHGITNDFIQNTEAWLKSWKDHTSPAWQKFILRVINTFIPLGYMIYLCVLQFA